MITGHCSNDKESIMKKMIAIVAAISLLSVDIHAQTSKKKKRNYGNQSSVQQDTNRNGRNTDSNRSNSDNKGSGILTLPAVGITV